MCVLFPPSRFLRTFGFGYVAEKDVHRLDAASKRLLQVRTDPYSERIPYFSLNIPQRYTDGINSFIRSSWFSLPIEYSLLRVPAVEEWSLVDTLAICRYSLSPRCRN